MDMRSVRYLESNIKHLSVYAKTGIENLLQIVNKQNMQIAELLSRIEDLEKSQKSKMVKKPKSKA